MPEAAPPAIAPHSASPAYLLAHVTEALTASDERFVMTYWDKAAETLFGWVASEALGRSSAEIFRTEIPGSSHEAAVAQLLEREGYVGEVTYRRKDGRGIQCLGK